MSINKKIKLISFILTTLLTNQFFVNNQSKVYADSLTNKEPQLINEENSFELKGENIEYLNSNYLKEEIQSSFYILGPDDIFFLRLNELTLLDNVPKLGGKFTIDQDGYVTLPRLKRVKAEGLTIEELTELLNLKYSNFVKNVDVVIKVINYRNSKIYLDGEVNSPGLHILSSNMKNESKDGNSSFYNNINPTPSGGRTLFDALRLAGGVSLRADLSNIEITRIDKLSNGGGRIKTKVNLFETLDLKDTTQNINLRDGDTVFVPIIKDKNSPELIKLVKSNLNPKFINVYISGRVKEPGIKQIFNSSSLVDGINIAGGAKIIRGKVRFLRYNNDGSIDKRIFNYRKNAKKGSFGNPYLNNGDIIFIGDNLLSTTGEVLSEVTDPLRGILSTYSFFKLIND